MIKIDATCSPCACCCGSEVDAIEHWQGEANRFGALLEVERAKDHHPTTGYAFVTFNSHVIARRMVQNFWFKHSDTKIDAPAAPIYASTLDTVSGTLMNVDHLSMGLAKKGLHAAGKKIMREPASPAPNAPRLPGTRWRVKRAPHPEDIIWENLKLQPRSRRLRWLLITAATWWLVLFWTIPIGTTSLTYPSFSRGK